MTKHIYKAVASEHWDLSLGKTQWMIKLTLTENENEIIHSLPRFWGFFILILMDHLFTILGAIFIIVLNFCGFFLKTWEYRFLKIYVIHSNWILGKKKSICSHINLQKRALTISPAFAKQPLTSGCHNMSTKSATNLFSGLNRTIVLPRMARKLLVQSNSAKCDRCDSKMIMQKTRH